VKWISERQQSSSEENACVPLARAEITRCGKFIPDGQAEGNSGKSETVKNFQDLREPIAAKRISLLKLSHLAVSLWQLSYVVFL